MPTPGTHNIDHCQRFQRDSGSIGRLGDGFHLSGHSLSIPKCSSWMKPRAMLIPKTEQMVQRADEIVMLEDGRMLEQGGHGDLIKYGRNYAKMYEMQLGGAIKLMCI